MSIRFIFLGITLLGSVITSSPVQAQGPYKDVSIASPNAASLGKYADIPVNYHTGIPQISIPIYTAKAGPLELPVSLSYHASGIKVLEPASWVGAGWSLNAGGVITRTVMGVPDERGTGNSSIHSKGYFSDFGFSNHILVPTANPSYFQEDASSFLIGKYDGEPDLFFFNFGSYSGKFYFNDDRTPVFVPQQDIKVEYNYTGTGSIRGFILTTPDGVKYFFGEMPGFSGTAPVERTLTISPDVGQTAGSTISSWFLQKIVSADDQFTISLDYQTENYGFYTLQMFPLPGTNTTDKEYKLIKNVVQGVKLNKISFPNGTIHFTGSTIRTDLSDQNTSFTDNNNSSSKALDEILITDSLGFCKKYRLWYSYFTDNITALTGEFSLSSYNYLQSDKRRLKLDSLKEMSCDISVVNPPYKFEYFSELLPRRLTFAQDHWGYFNGATTNSTLIPTYKLTELGNVINTYPGANREPAWPQMRGGTLNKITYPTGGSNLLEFEPNSVYTSIQQPVIVNITNRYIGFSGANPLYDNSQWNLIAGTYQMSLNNVGSGSTASLSLYLNGNLIRSISVPVGSPSQTVTFNLLNPGLYTLTLYKDCQGSNGMTNGNGAEGSLSRSDVTYISQNTSISGLRIKSTRLNDAISISNDIVTNYSYNESNGRSSGVLFGTPAYVQVVRNDIMRDIGFFSSSLGFEPHCSTNGCMNCDGVGIQTFYKSPNSIRPMGSTQGSHIGYATVKVSKTGNGYSEYKYYLSEMSNPPFLNQGDISVKSANIITCDPALPNMPTPSLPFDYKRGQLQTEKHYNEAGQLLKEVNYEPVYTTNKLTTPAISFAVYTYTIFTRYSLKTSRLLRSTVTETNYTPGMGATSIKSISYYESPWHSQLTKKQTIGSNGDTIEARYKYAFDFRIPNCDNLSDGISQLSTDSVNCYNQYVTDNAACNGTNPCRTQAYLKYITCLYNARNNFITTRRNNFTNSGNQFGINHDAAETNADGNLKPILELQDLNMNLLVEQSSWRGGLLSSAGFYKYDFSTSPAGKVYLQKSQNISLPVMSSSFVQANTAPGAAGLTKDTRYTDEAQYTFNTGNPVETTPKSGITTSYVWGYNNLYPIAQITGSPVADAAYSGFESSAKGSFTYSGASVADITSPTGQNCYNVSAGSIQRTGLTTSKSYILSYWYKTGAAITVTAGTQSNVVTGATRNGWTLRQLQFTGTATATLSGTGFVDEIRIYPVGAQMQTYSYSPLVGLTSACDPNNMITYYEFDKIGRLKNIEDQNRDITKSIFYNYQLNPSAMPQLAGVSILVLEGIAGTTVTAQLTSKTTGQTYSITNWSGMNVPVDVYDITVSHSPYNGPALYEVCSYSVTGPTATFYNVSISPTTCNLIVFTQ